MTASSTSRPLSGLFAAEVISTTGTEMTSIALPWFVLVSTGSPARMGAVLAAEFVGMSVLGLWGGPIATILGPRRMMLASDLSRAALIALVPIMYWVGALSFPFVLAVGFVVGAFFPAYKSSQRLVLAGIVSDDELRLTRTGGLIGSANETASFIGPALGGLLVASISAAGVLVVDAASYLCAFILVTTLVPAALIPATTASAKADGAAKADEADGADGADGAAKADGTDEADKAGHSVLEGLRYLTRHRGLRRQVAGIGLIEIGWTAMVATLPVLALHHGGASVAGWLLASYGGGSVLGALISSRARRTGGNTAAWAVAGIAGATWLLLLPVPVWALAGAVAANGLCSGLFFPRFFSALTAGTPPGLRARVMTSVMIAMSAPGPVGFLGAGLLAQRTGSTTLSLLLVAICATLGAAVTFRGLRTPTAPERHRSPQPAGDRGF